MKQYDVEEIREMSPLNVIEEASRCLLCHDAPCSKGCPAKTNPDRFIRAIRFRNFKGAVEIVRENNSLAGICARVCPTEKLCMMECSRCGIDRPIEIGQIQRFITDYENATNMTVFNKGSNNKEKIAVIGSGPSGLEAAYQLTKMGYKVSIYEKEDELGGWLRYGIPEYRLPRDVLNKEITRIIDTGIEVITNTTITLEKLEELKRQYKAILLAIGKNKGKTIDIFKDNDNVFTAVDILTEIKKGRRDFNWNSVCIVGGGDVAMDIAVSLKKLGVKTVSCVCRETKDEFIASKIEKEMARINNISILDGYTPIECNENEVIFEHLKINSSLKIKADAIIMGVGQFINLNDLEIEQKNGKVVVDKYQINNSKLFACGDIVEKDETVVSAIASGRQAACAINKYLGGEDNA